MKKACIPETAQERYYRAAAKLADIPIHEKGCISWIGGQRPGYPRAIFRTQFRRNDIDRVVQDVKARMRAGELPGMWTETPGARPRGLERYLLSHGYTIAWPAAGMVLGRLSPRPPIQADYTVQPLADGAYMPEWSRIVTAELFKGGDDMAAGFADFIRAIWRDERIRLFAAVKDEQLLGTATLCIVDGMAWIGHVAVPSDARRQGIGSQLAWQAAKWAKDYGTKTVALHASELGEPVYLKLGFQVVSRIRRLRLADE